MHAFAVFAVNDHLDYLLAEAAERRRARRFRPSLRSRLAAAIDAFRVAAPANGLPRSSFPTTR